jgi:hypothetical protein
MLRRVYYRNHSNNILNDADATEHAFVYVSVRGYVTFQRNKIVFYTRRYILRY